MDKIDKKLLSRLQGDCQRSVAELGAEVGLSPSACHRRIKQLEADRTITGYSARVDPKALGYTMQLVIEVTLSSQKSSDLEAFERAVSAVPEIIECHLMAGGTDYLLRVVARDVEDFERIHRERLSKMPHIARMQSQLMLRSVRALGAYPVG
jgi:Lrp/AsnC family transcriptional regulator, leucine-responsive regulatory protein